MDYQGYHDWYTLDVDPAKYYAEIAAVQDPDPQATARTRDGVVEAIEPLDPRIRVLGVQFHPEAHAVAGDTTMRKFFVHLVREAAREMSGSLAERKR